MSMNFIRKYTQSYLRDVGSNAGLALYFKNTVWLFFEKLVRVAFGLGIGIWVARYLGPKDFGILNYAISFVLLFSALSAIGLDNIVVKELTESRYPEADLMGTSFAMKLGACICAYALIAFVSFQMNNVPQTNKIILIVAISLLFQPMNVLEFFFRSQVRARYFAMSSIISLIFVAIFRAYLIISQGELFFFAGVFAIEYLITGVALIFFYTYSRRSPFQWRFEIRIAADLFRLSWPLLFSGIMISIYMRIDQVMIQKMLGNQSVGFYSSAVRISEAWYFIPLVLCQSLLPSIVNAKSYDKVQYNVRMQKLYEMIALVSTGITLPIFLLSNALIPFIYGAEYAPAGPALQYHVWAGMFVGLGLASSNWLLVENLQRYQMFNLTCGAVINIVLNYFLINRFNIQGAAVATLISYFYSSYAALLFFSKTRPCFFSLTSALFQFRFFSSLFGASIGNSK